MNILLIDDETVCGELARANIKHEFEDAEVEQALNCELGLKALERAEYDALILDLNLKCSIDGFECLKIVRETWPNLPIVILTGALPEERREECLAAGADYFVVKGSLSAVLGLGIRTAIEKRKAALSGECYVEERRKQLAELRSKVQRYDGTGATDRRKRIG